MTPKDMSSPMPMSAGTTEGMSSWRSKTQQIMQTPTTAMVIFSSRVTGPRSWSISFISSRLISILCFGL